MVEKDSVRGDNVIDIRDKLSDRIADDLLYKIRNRGVNLDNIGIRYQYNLYRRCKLAV